jgi:pimeloyl-ACP methyl ester carboxylesterase
MNSITRTHTVHVLHYESSSTFQINLISSLTMLTQTNLLFAALALWPFLVHCAAVLPVVGNPRYDVAITTSMLTDTDRLDPYTEDGRARSIMISSFNPVTKCHHKTQQPYMPPATAAFEDEKYAAYGLPNGTFRSLNLETCSNGTTTYSACSSNTLPVVLFSGALATSRLIYSAMLQNIAAAGYLVVSIDHPYDSDIVEFPNDTLITGVNIESDAELDLALKTRTQDLLFMHSQLANTTITDALFPGHLRGRKSPQMAMMGHSLGGAATAAAMLADPSIVAGLNLDGSMFGAVLTAGLDQPFMLMGHENKTQTTDPSWAAVWPLLRGFKKEFEVKGTAHYSFSDLPLVTAVLGLQDVLPAEVGEVLGTVEGKHMTGLVAAYATKFFEAAFEGGKGEGLVGGNKEFPEIVEIV